VHLRGIGENHHRLDAAIVRGVGRHYGVYAAALSRRAMSERGPS
jgi:hypothetical protein